MSDQEPVLPPPWNKRLALLLGVVWICLTSLEKYYPGAMAISVASDIVAGVSLLFGVPLVGKAAAKAVAPALLAGLLLLAPAGCALSSHDIAVRFVRGFQQGRDLMVAQAAATMRSEHAKCKTKHGAKTEAFAVCVKSVLAFHKGWSGIGRPVVNTSAQVAVTALQTKAWVDKCKANKDCAKQVLAFLGLGYCAIVRGLKQFGHLFSDKGQAVLASLAIFEGVTCGD